MRITRDQKRWLRRHRGLLITSGILLVLVIAALIYCYLLAIGSVKLPGFIAEVVPEYETIAKPDWGNKQETEPSTENVLTPNPITLTEPEKEAVVEYVPAEGVEHPYYVKVNRVMNCVTIYGMDENGEYTIPVKAMVCSVGKEGQETPLDISKTTDMYEFHPMVDGTFAQFAYRFNVGGILFHSVPYFTKNKDDLETEQFNMLGSPASLGCVRLCVRDALWLQENISVGTTVEVYDDPTTPGPLGKPEMIKIPLDSPYAKWDPTDPDENNPWHQFSATIEGALDVSITAGEAFDPAAGVSAKDTCGNDITDRLVIVGTYDCNTPGQYVLTYKVTDLIDSKAEVSRTLTVQ